MATIVRTDAGKWKAVIRKSGWPTVTKTFRTKRDAQDWARGTEDEIVRGVYIDRAGSDRLTLRDALDRYLREVSPTKKASSAQSDRNKARMVIPRLGSYSLAALTPDVVARYRDERLSEGKSPSTVRLELALVSHLYTVAIREWRLGLVYNPVANIRKPSEGQGRDRRLGASEAEELLAACQAHNNPMLKWIVELALETTMRAGEITSLRLDQVDFDARVVRLSETKNGSPRTVPLTRNAAAILKQAVDNPVRPAETDLIFFGNRGRDGKIRPYSYKSAWHRITRHLGFKDLRFHDLRHEAVSRLVEAGLGDQEVAAISGHKSMQMLKRYTHLRAEDLVSRLDELEKGTES